MANDEVRNQFKNMMGISGRLYTPYTILILLTIASSGFDAAYDIIIVDV